MELPSTERYQNHVRCLVSKKLRYKKAIESNRPPNTKVVLSGDDNLPQEVVDSLQAKMEAMVKEAVDRHRRDILDVTEKALSEVPKQYGDELLDASTKLTSPLLQEQLKERVPAEVAKMEKRVELEEQNLILQMVEVWSPKS